MVLGNKIGISYDLLSIISWSHFHTLPANMDKTIMESGHVTQLNIWTTFLTRA
jgi:hypothetical protein